MIDLKCVWGMETVPKDAQKMDLLDKDFNYFKHVWRAKRNQI